MNNSEPKNTYLIVDDSTFIFNRLVDLLGDQTAKKMNTAHTFSDVAAILEENTTDIILLDINSLETKELFLMSVLKDLYPHISIIMLSGKYNKYYLDQSKKIGKGYFIENVSDIDNVSEVLDFKKKFINKLVA